MNNNLPWWTKIFNPDIFKPKCETCTHYGEKSVTGNCIKCRDFDRYEPTTYEVKKND